MVTRQTDYKDLSYFETYNEYLSNFNEKAVAKIRSSSSDILIQRILSAMYLNNIDLVASQYTAGRDIRVISDSYEWYVKFTSQYTHLSMSKAIDYFDVDDYLSAMHILCFEYLLCREKPSSARLEWLKNLPYVDGDLVLRRILHALDNVQEVNGLDLAYPNTYRPLKVALDLRTDENERQRKLVEFLHGYYESLGGYKATMYNNHLENDPDFCRHSGYWAFELAALVVIMNWDDSAFRDHPIYPKDMVDWARANKDIN